MSIKPEDAPLFRQHEHFEKWVLAAAVRKWRIMQRLMSSICVEIPGREFKLSDDFSTPELNRVFVAARTTYNTMTDKEKETEDSIVLFRQRFLDLIRMAPAGELLDPVNSINTALSIATGILDMSADVLATCVPYAEPHHVGPWLETRKIAMVAAHLPSDATRGKLQDIDEVIRRFEQIKLQVGSGNTQSTLQNVAGNFSAILRNPELADIHKIERLETPWRELNERLLGGIPKGLGTLICAAQGGGKTICAGQLAAFAAQHGKLALIISTEEPESTFQFRTAAALGCVPWNLISDKSVGKIDETTRQDLLNLFEPLDSYIMYEDWRDKKAINIEMDLPPVLEQFKSIHKQYPDILVYDWIGAGVDRHPLVTKIGKPALIESLGTSFCRMAEAYGFAGVATAQVKPTVGNTKYVLDRGDIKDCTALGVSFTTVIMISSLKRRDVITKATGTDVQKKQCMNIDKTRGGFTGSFYIHADFSYQRFRDWGNGSNLIVDQI